MYEIAVTGIIIGILVIMVLGARLAALESRLQALSRLDAKVDALLKHAGIEFNPVKEVSPAVLEALSRGKKIDAIKHYRAATGVGLKDAKEAVEEIQRLRGPIG